MNISILCNSGGRLNLFHSNFILNFFEKVYSAIISYCKRRLRQCNLFCLYNEIMTGVNYFNLTDNLAENVDMSEESINGFTAFITKLFIRICFYKFVHQKADKIREEVAKVKPLRSDLKSKSKMTWTSMIHFIICTSFAYYAYFPVFRPRKIGKAKIAKSASNIIRARFFRSF